MNNNTLYIIRLLCLLPLLGIMSCTDKYKEEYLMTTPVYLTYDELRNAVKFDTNRDIMKPGRIHFKGDTLFIVENYAGIHVLRLNNPAEPEKTGFINIPGCTDLSIRNNILYANSYVDLVGMDISDLGNIRETARKTDVFQYAIPITDDIYLHYDIDKTKGIVINWEVKKISWKVKKTSENPEIDLTCYPQYNANAPARLAPAGSFREAPFGPAGSKVTFGLYDRYLYTLNDRSKVDVFEVNSSDKIDKINSINSDYIRTMFLHDGHMFLGTSTGVNVFSLNVPSKPTLNGIFQHLTACNPVIIEDGYAYYTLQERNYCGNDINRLDVLKLSDNYQTNELIATYGMTQPFGLKIDRNILFVCDGSAGLKVYDATDKTKIADNILAVFPDIQAYDVIPMEEYLFAIGQDGFHLYDYKDIKNIKRISSIPITGLY